MVSYHRKCSSNWTTAELLDLLSTWEEEAVQSQLRCSHGDFDTYRQISRGLCKIGYDWDSLQCRVKTKELRQAYCEEREANHCSGAAPKTRWFYKKLDAILSGYPTSIAKSPVDTCAGKEVADKGPHPEAEVIDKELELEDNVELRTGSLGGTGSRELFTTPEVSSQSQQLLSSNQEAGEEKPAHEPNITK